MCLAGFLGLHFPRTADSPNEPAPIVIICLISDLTVAGRYSASFSSSSPSLGRLRLCLRLPLVRLVSSFEFLRGSRSPWGFIIIKICDDNRMGAAVVLVFLCFLVVLIILFFKLRLHLLSHLLLW